MEIIKKTKILVVEDEIIVALEIKNAIEQYGYKVTDTVTNYTTAIQSVKDNQPDMIFMDINLENSLDGIEIVNELQKTYDIPIVYLTAFSDEKTICRAVKTAPISYINKPFKIEDIKSSIILSMYKIHNKVNSFIKNNYVDIGYNYYFDKDTSNLYYKEKFIKLSKNEKKLLRLLIASHGNEVSFEIISEYIWHGRKISDSNVRTLVYRLRLKLEFKLIDTILTYGYKLSK